MPAQRRRRTARAGAGLLDFAGERSAPQRPEEVALREPLLASGKPPRELVALRLRRRLYVSSSGRDKPHVIVEKAETRDTRTLWRIDLQYREGQDLTGALYGRRAERRSPEILLREIDPHVGFSGHRPAWVGASSTPRMLPHYHAPMRRINGRPVDPLYIFGADNRFAYLDPSWPWGLVGKIFNNQGFVGSGALVWGNVVVTAGHMVPWSSDPWWMRFVPAYYDGTSLHGAGVESYVSDAIGYDPSGDVTGYDWAILRLYNPLGSWLGYFGYNGYSDDWEDDPYWTVLGYPGGVAGGQRPSYQSGASVFDDDSDSDGGRELETRADMTPGNSGGPMFGWWSGDPRIIGVVSGQEEDWVNAARPAFSMARASFRPRTQMAG